jgi:hypothetical protein
MAEKKGRRENQTGNDALVHDIIPRPPIHLIAKAMGSIIVLHSVYQYL